ncbi:MAG TPA: hypothetical protein ACFYDZ_07290, partial [Candidatus Brocadiaceae bacterium]
MSYQRKPLVICIFVLIALFFILLYCTVFCGTFTHGNFEIIADHPQIKEWRYLPEVFTRNYFVSSRTLSYQPFVTFTYFIDYAIWHTNPLGFHLTNVIFHTINSLLFYIFLRYVVQDKLIVLFSTLFFVTHPVLAETINVITYRSDILAATFILVSLIFFIKADTLTYAAAGFGRCKPVSMERRSNTNPTLNIENPEGGSKMPNHNTHKGLFSLYYAISLIAYVCALFSKEMAITLPALLPLLVIFSGQNIRQGMGRRLKGIYIGYMAIAVLFLVFRFFIIRSVEVKAAYLPGGFWPNVFTMVRILASYVKLSFFPYNLHPDSMVHITKTPLEWAFMLSVAFLISVFIIFTCLCKSRNIFACWMAWFFITLLPVMNIIPIHTIMADRYLYIPIIGFCAAKGILIYRITDPTLSTHA